MDVTKICCAVLALTGCAAPHVELSAEIPASVLVRLSGLDPTAADAELPPVRFEYLKTWYDGTVAIRFRRRPGGVLETEVISTLNADDARAARIADDYALGMAGQELFGLLQLAARAYGVPSIAEPAPQPDLDPNPLKNPVP